MKYGMSNAEFEKFENLVAEYERELAEKAANGESLRAEFYLPLVQAKDLKKLESLLQDHVIYYVSWEKEAFSKLEELAKEIGAEVEYRRRVRRGSAETDLGLSPEKANRLESLIEKLRNWYAPDARNFATEIFEGFLRPIFEKGDAESLKALKKWLGKDSFFRHTLNAFIDRLERPEKYAR